jgi:cysteinyl-tRNA synthetase
VVNMPLMVYNTLKREKEEFLPMHGNRVNMFVCGPTVYDLSHLGHARTYIAFDIIARYLRFRGYSLFYLMNMTDVDDKIIRRARERDMETLELAREYEELFHEDMKSLSMNSVNLYARASEHIPEIISQTQALLEKGYAYEVDGNVYFEIAKFKDYGKLSHQRPEELRRHRIDPDRRKKNPQDFSLWKKQKPGELAWESPWGPGRPGWHIEDTAITTAYLGNRYDIHGGAVELVFPHHEAEIAQAEAATGESPLVKYWLHTGVLNIGGRKMSKSLGNFITIREALKRYNPEVLRLFFSSTHYRSNIDLDEENLEQAERSLETLYNAVRLIRRLPPREGTTVDEEGIRSMLLDAREKFVEAMDDDFNAPSALVVLFELAKESNKYVESHGYLKEEVKGEILLTFKELGGVFGILQREEEAAIGVQEDLINLILELRERFRDNRDWNTSDAIRERLREMGILLEDTSHGVRWRKEVHPSKE